MCYIAQIFGTVFQKNAKKCKKLTPPSDYVILHDRDCPLDGA